MNLPIGAEVTNPSSGTEIVLGRFRSRSDLIAFASGQAQFEIHTTPSGGVVGLPVGMSPNIQIGDTVDQVIWLEKQQSGCLNTFSSRVASTITHSQYGRDTEYSSLLQPRRISGRN